MALKVLSVLLATLYFANAQSGISFELEGRFVERSGPHTYGSSLSAKANIGVPFKERIKRAVGHESGLDFTGRLTIRERREVIVVGVNTTFEFEDINDSEPNADSNRLKRDTSPYFKINLYGEFALGDLLPESQVLRVRINLDLSRISSNRRPSTNLPKGPHTEIGFKGTISAKNGDSQDAVNFGLYLGLQQDPPRRNSDYDYYTGESPSDREKREASGKQLKIDGELTVNDPWYTTVVGVNGDASLAVAALSDGPNPREDFQLKSDRDHILIETAGNVTGKLDDRTMFTFPVGTVLNLGAEEVRSKRGIMDSDDQILSLDYDGVFKQTLHSGRMYPTGITARSKFWEISRTEVDS